MSRQTLSELARDLKPFLLAQAGTLAEDISDLEQDMRISGGLYVKGTLPWADVRAWGAVGDGVADDQTAIDLALAAVVAAGGGVVFFPAGTYKITAANGINILASNVALIGQAGAVLLKNGDAGAITVGRAAGSNISNIHIQGFKITSNTTYHHNAGIVIAPDTDNTVNHLTIRDVKCDQMGQYGIVCSGGEVNWLTIEACRVISNGANSTSTGYANDWTRQAFILNAKSTSHDWMLTDIYAESRYWGTGADTTAVKIQGASRVVIRNFIAKGGSPNTMVLDQMEDWSVSGLVCIGVGADFSGTGGTGLMMTCRNNIGRAVVSDVAISGDFNSDYGMVLGGNTVALDGPITQCTQLKVANVKCMGDGLLTSTDAITHSGVEFENCYFAGGVDLYAQGTHTAQFDAGAFRNCVAGAGIFRVQGDSNHISGCRVLASNTIGLRVIGDNNVIIGNDILSPVGEGIYIEGSTNVIKNNVVRMTQANYDGIRIASGTNNLIADNLIKGVSGTGKAIAIVSGAQIVTPNDTTDSSLYTASDTTPNVAGVRFLRVTGTPTITDFDFGANIGTDGQVLTLLFASASAVVTRAAAFLAGSADFTSTANSTLTLVYYSGNWYEVSRSTTNG